jgi:hypothetical protein
MKETFTPSRIALAIGELTKRTLVLGLLCFRSPSGHRPDWRSRAKEVVDDAAHDLVRFSAPARPSKPKPM